MRASNILLSSRAATATASVFLCMGASRAFAPHRSLIARTSAGVADCRGTQLFSTEESSEIVQKSVADLVKALPRPLIDAKGDEYESDEDIYKLIEGHRVALYFGAGWCPMCRDLETVMFPQYRNALRDGGQPIQLIYVPSDRSLEFQLGRMEGLDLQFGVPFGEAADALKVKHKIWSGMESSQPPFKDADAPRRSGVPSFVVLDTNGDELAYLDTESETISALSNWPLDDPQGIF